MGRGQTTLNRLNVLNVAVISFKLFKTVNLFESFNLLNGGEKIAA